MALTPPVVLLLAAAVPLAAPARAQDCSCTGLDYTDGGSYLVDGSSDLPFTFHSVFSGCQDGYITPILLDAAGTQYNCSEIETQPDDVQQSSECNVAYSQMQTGSYTIILQSSDFDFASQRQFRVTVGSQGVVVVTVTPTESVGVTVTPDATTETSDVVETQTVIEDPETVTLYCAEPTHTVLSYIPGPTSVFSTVIQRWATNGAITNYYQTTVGVDAYCHWPASWVSPTHDRPPPPTPPPQPGRCDSCRPWYTSGSWMYTHPPSTTPHHARTSRSSTEPSTPWTPPRSTPTRPPPSSSSTHHDNPPPTSSHHDNPPPSSTHREPPPPSSSQHDNPPPSSTQHGNPPPSPPPSSTHHGNPPPSSTPSSTRRDPPPTTSHRDPPPPSSSRHDSPPPSSTHRDPPPPSSTRHDNPPPSSTRRDNPPPSSTRRGNPPPSPTREPTRPTSTPSREPVHSTPPSNQNGGGERGGGSARGGDDGRKGGGGGGGPRRPGARSDSAPNAADAPSPPAIARRSLQRLNDVTSTVVETTYTCTETVTSTAPTPTVTEDDFYIVTTTFVPPAQAVCDGDSYVPTVTDFYQGPAQTEYHVQYVTYNTWATIWIGQTQYSTHTDRDAMTECWQGGGYYGT